MNLPPSLMPACPSSGTNPVSYTHLDVYKRQVTLCLTDAQKQEIDARYTGGAFIQGLIRAEVLGDDEGVLEVCWEKELNLCCFFLWRFKRVPVFMAGAFVILPDFKLQG